MSVHPANDTPDPTDRARRPLLSRKQQVVASAAVLLLATTVLGLTSLALFTDTEQAGANSFTTGTIDIAATPATTALTMPSMAPGDQTTGPLDIANTGSLDLRYATTANTTEDVLAAALVLTVKSGVSSCTDAGFGSSGTTLYSGPLGTIAGTAVLGSTARGADAGDRTLAPGSSEQLCLNVALPVLSTVGTGSTTTATFTFDAEQTRNNP